MMPTRSADASLPPVSPSVGVPGRSPSLATALAASLAVRALTLFASGLVVIVAGMHSIPKIVKLPGLAMFPYAGPLGRAVDAWANWDGAWFLRIAAHGYHYPGSEAFFPLYPLLVRAVTPVVGGRYVIAGLLVSLICYVAATWLLYRLVEREFSSQTALWTVVFMAVFPTSFFFQAVYSESLFLLATVAAFYFADRQRWALAGLAGFAASLTRNSGILVVLPVAIFYLQSREWRWRRIDRSALWLGLIPAGLGTWMAWLYARFGDPLMFMHVESRWHRHFELASTTLSDGTANWVHGVDHLLLLHGQGVRGIHNLIALPFVALALALIVVCWSRVRLPYAVYATAAAFLPLSFPSHVRPFFSFPRFALVIFPLFIAMALLAEHQRWLRLAIVVVSLAGLVWLTSEFSYLIFVS